MNEPTTRYRVTVHVAGREDYTVELDAPSEGRACTRAMVTYPTRLLGAHVEYTVEEI